MKLIISLFLMASFVHSAQASDLQWARIKATNKFERTALIEKGLNIEVVNEDSVVVLATQEELNKVKDLYEIEVQFNYGTLDFPAKDSKFHNYNELTEAMRTLATENPDLVSMETIGQSIEGRDIWAVTISANQETHMDHPGILFMGGHHAREHISVEMPIMLAQHLVSSYRANDMRITGLLNTRSVYIIPVVNPDGKEHDIASGRYRSWRKNRRVNSDGTIGVDLNRNYGFMWGNKGASSSPSSDTYRGTSAFSEPETQAMRDFYLSHTNLTINLSYHTFSELILYPWGHTYDSITDNKDLQTHKIIAEKMATWNNYTPQQGSDLYIVSGDTTDWAYGELGLVSFTFELDPKSIFQGGFYPGQSKIKTVFDKNIEPALYLIDLADNPYRVSQPTHFQYGLSSAIID